jgi:bifunctional non-homologous end joining protein LigD
MGARRTSAAAAAREGRLLAGQVGDEARSLRLRVGAREVALTNLDKPYWPDGRTKGDLVRYYLRVSPHLLPHLLDRPMVMKRYPDGIAGPHFFMKRKPAHAPDWLATCTVEHANAGLVDFPIVDDLAALLWIVNLGCIDLNPWYSRCDDVDRPDFMVFDLDPVEGRHRPPFARVREAALVVREALERLRLPAHAKTTGSRGIHVYVPLRRGPLTKEVWAVAKAIAHDLAARHPRLLTAEYRKAKRPAGRVLVDYNQNSWGRTLASVYSVRPRPRATVSAPVTWKEIEDGIEIEDFTVEDLPRRLTRVGDLWRELAVRAKGVRLPALGTVA